ncbi:MAG TPA: winged helix-turn-helix domain-containing protein, partial [Stellaceae bacterium]
TPSIIEFGHFRIVLRRRELLADGQPIHLGGRAFDVLMALIEARGTIRGKGALMARVWPNRVVEEKNLHAQISALRTVLGAERELIRTVPGRGYQFTGEIRVLADEHAASDAATTEPRSALPPTNLPASVSELIGRDAEREEILGLTAARRLVTLTGAGGIGKTSLGLAVARHLLPKFADGVWVIELAPLTDPDLVPATVATALGLDLADEFVSPERVANALASKQLLLLLDNCEHLVGAAASMAVALLGANAAARVLATSREPLRAEGECLYRVPALAVPTEGSRDAEDPLGCGAVRLFVVRARASGAHVSEDRRVTAVIAAICRRLDGIALAIELAAARAAALGIDELAARLDDRFRLLTGGRRTALPRHQTLRATLDWSYELLPEPERMILRRLAVFAGIFTLEAASTVAAIGEIAGSDIVDCAASLVAKSLVAADLGGATGRYRLLDTTRAYAFEKLAESGELGAVARRHAEYHRGLFERAETEWDTRPTAEWLADYGRQIDDLRAALDWAFSPNGDLTIGVALTVAAVPLWFQLSLVDECLGWVERALAALDMAPGPDERRRMQLYAALGWLQMYATARLESSTAAWRTALRLAEELEDTDYQLRALWALWADRTNHAEFGEALTLASQYRSLSARAGNTADQLVGDRMTGASLHFLGNQAGARECIERMLGRYTTPVSRSHVVRFQFDQRVTARITLARVLWLQGLADQALREAKGNIERAVSINHTLSLCNALAQGTCPIALLVGDFVMAERYTAMLRSHTKKNTLDVWRAYADCFDGERLIRCGDLDTGVSLLGPAVDELCRAGFVQYHTPFVVALALGLTRAGRVADARLMIDQALERCGRTGESWALAELHRARGRTLLSGSAFGANQAAEVAFLQSLDIARAQKVLSWELRAATSLARLWRDQNRSTEAIALLAPIYNRFTEGFETADLKTAKALIDSLPLRGRRSAGRGWVI